MREACNLPCRSASDAPGVRFTFSSKLASFFFPCCVFAGVWMYFFFMDYAQHSKSSGASLLQGTSQVLTSSLPLAGAQQVFPELRVSTTATGAPSRWMWLFWMRIQTCQWCPSSHRLHPRLAKGFHLRRSALELFLEWREFWMISP